MDSQWSPVIIRGLGLSFFDLMSRLTEGRGGQFQKAPDGLLVYHPSGREPHIFAGSRRGFPYRAKGRNQKGPGDRLVGWLAHNIENKLYDGRIMRPATKYVGDLVSYIRREDR